MEDTQTMNIKDEISDVSTTYKNIFFFNILKSTKYFFSFFSQLLKELDMNIDVDVAYLAGQNPPIKLFPKENSIQLPYIEQMEQLKSEYLKHYSYRGDLNYNEKMARSVGKSGKVKCGEEETCMYRVCRDKNRFYQARIKDDALILGKILESMIERTSEMEKYLENVLRDAGETTMPNWDELFEYNGAISNAQVGTDTAKYFKNDSSKRSSSNTSAAPQQQNQPMMTHDRAQMLVAQMLLARSIAQPNRLQWKAQYLDSITPTN